MLLHAGTQIIVALATTDGEGNLIPLQPITAELPRLSKPDWDDAWEQIEMGRANREAELLMRLAPPEPAEEA